MSNIRETKFSMFMYKTTTIKDVINNIDDWKFITFRTEFDINMIREKGYYTAEENLSEGFMFNVAKDYFGVNGAVWFYGFKGNLLRDSYIIEGQDIMVEFRPKKINDKYNPLPFIIETDKGKKYLTQDIFNNTTPDIWRNLTEEESREMFLINLGAKEYIENMELENLSAVCDGEAFIGIMPKLEKDMIVKMTSKGKSYKL